MKCRFNALLRNVLNTVKHYSFIALVLTLIFCLVLYCSGLCNEKMHASMRKNLKESVVQMINEGDYPKILNGQDPSYRLDNYTDSIILQQAYLMDTAKDPSVIFSNPYVNKTYANEEISDRALALEEARTKEQGNAHYTYYWLGIRSIIRLLLYFFTYQNIRGIIAIGFIALWFICMFVIYRSLGKYYAIAFFVSVVCMNIPVVTSEIQFATCFYVMFLAAIAIVRWWRCSKNMTPFFFVIGSVTQYFDFYTYPLITLVFPLLVFQALKYRFSSENQMKDAGKCVFAWLAGYGLFWTIRLGLVQLFTEHDNTIEKAFSRFSTWTGITSQNQYSQFTIWHTMQLCFETLFMPHNILLFIVAGCMYGISLLRCGSKHSLRRPDWSCLLIAVLPLAWIAVASRATGNHYWFQYRILAAYIFSLLAFLSSMFAHRGETP